VNSSQYSLTNNFTDFVTPEYNYGYGPINIGVKNSKDQWGILNKQGELLIEPQYCDVMSSSDGYVIVAQCGAVGAAFKYGVIDLMNNIVIPFEYDSIESVYGESYECTKDGMIYTINLNNEILSKRKVTEDVENN
jgi:hypothetical protein